MNKVNRVKTFLVVYLIILICSLGFNIYINPHLENYLEKFVGEDNIGHAVTVVKVTTMVPLTFWILIPLISLLC